MEQELKNIIKERFDNLPPVIQRAIQSANLHTQVEEIAKKHQLHIDQMGNVEDEVILVMLGLEDPADFAGNIVAHAQVSKEAAAGIAQEVGERIFLPIRGYMQTFMEEQAESARSVVAEITAPATPAAEKSVVMPSKLAAASAPAAPTAPASAPAPMPEAPPPAAATPKPPAPAPDLHAAEVMLTEKTVQTPTPSAPAASAPAPQPQPYKTDPYREPIE